MDGGATDRINAAVNRAMASPDMRKALLDSGALPIEPAPTAVQWQTEFNEQVQIWGRIADSARITLD